MASASPYVEEYLPSGVMLNLPPAKTRFHPSLLYIGVTAVHLQFFCWRENPSQASLTKVCREAHGEIRFELLNTILKKANYFLFTLNESIL